MIVARLKIEAEVGREKGASQLGDKLLPSIPIVAEPLAPKISIQPRRMAGGVNRLMPADSAGRGLGPQVKPGGEADAPSRPRVDSSHAAAA